MFAYTDTSQAKGMEFLGRFLDADLMIPTKLSHLLAGLIPDARIRIYPDSAHGFPFPYPTEVAADVNALLAREEGRAGS
jgi:pimeloyl-ACP methyl ester carboxylesterase